MSMKHNFRSKHGCVVCGRKSSTSRFKSSEPYSELFPAAFGIDYKKGDFCNPCSLALTRFKKDPEGKRRDFSGRVNKCKRVNGQEKKVKVTPEKKVKVMQKTLRKQLFPKHWEPSPSSGFPFPNVHPIPVKQRRKHAPMPDQPWMKYTNMWKPTPLHENGVEYSALVNHSLKMYLINGDTARPCSICAMSQSEEDTILKQVESVPPTTLPPTPILQLPPSPSTSSMDEDKSLASSPSTSCSCKENMAPEMEEEEEEMETDSDVAHRNPSAEDATSALMNICQAATSELYRQHMEKDTRYLRAAPSQGMQPMSVGCMP